MNENLGMLGAFMASVTWAMGSAVYGRLSAKYSPFAVNFSRAAISFPLWLVICLVFARSSFALLTWDHVGWFGLSMISSYVFADALFLMSIQTLGLPGAHAIASTYPLWSALAGSVFKGEKLATLQGVGLVVVVAGSVLVIMSRRKESGAQPGAQRSLFIGTCLGLATSILWSLNAFAVSKGGAGLPASLSNMVRMGFGFFLCPVLGFFHAGRSRMFLPRAEFKKNTVIFFIESFLGSAFFVYGLTHAPLGAAACLSSLAPVITVPIALLKGLEKPSFMRIAGVIAVVGGIICLILG